MAEAKRLTPPLRVVFFGSPAFASTSLERLLQAEETEVAAVYTQPDRPAGRGRQLQESAVKRSAETAGVPVHQPERLGDPAVLQAIRDYQPDLLAVVAYGSLLPSWVLGLAPHGAFNVHASLLPRYRGAAPIQRAIQHGEKVTGVTVMQMDTGMDTGPILLQRAVAIGLQDTAETLHDQLAATGGDLLIQACRRLIAGDLLALEQDEAQATYAPKLSKEEGRIVWDRPAAEVHDHIRAMHPWPGAWFDWQRQGASKPLRVMVFPGEPGPAKEGSVPPGRLDHEPSTGRLAIACRDRYYMVSRLKPAAGKPLTAKAFSCGYLSTGRG